MTAAEHGSAHLGRDLRRHVSPEAADQLEGARAPVPSPARAEQRAGRGGRQPEILGLEAHAPEALRGDADHAVGLAGHLDRPAHGGRVPPVPAVPCSVGENGRTFAGFLLRILAVEQHPGLRHHAEEGKKVAADDRRPALPCALSAADHYRLVGDRRDSLEAIATRSEVEQVRERKRARRDLAGTGNLKGDRQAPHLLRSHHVGRRPEQKGVYDAEHRTGDSNPQGQRHDNRETEPEMCAPDRAKATTQIGKHSVHGKLSPRR